MRIKVIKAIPAKQKLIRVCAYIRVSSNSDEQEESLEAQRQYFVDHINSNTEWVFAGIYADNGISGFVNERPDFQRLMEDARAGKFDLVLVKSVSRFARNTETLLKATRELKQLGIGVQFELQHINTLTQAGELMLTVKAAFAQGESDSGSDLLKMSYQRKFSQGIATPFSATTYGYKPGMNGEIRIDEKRAFMVRLIFDLADQGLWGSNIANELNRRGIPSPEKKQWTSSQITRMLHNVMYKGDLILQKNYSDAHHKKHKNHGEVQSWYITENHPAIITPEQWDRIQLRYEERKHANLRTPTEKRSCRNHYPLTGLLFCPHCGAVMHHKWCNSGRDEYWVCSTNIKKRASSCKGIFLPARIAAGWEVDEPMVVVPYRDQYDMPRFTAFPKDEFEAMKGDIM